MLGTYRFILAVMVMLSHTKGFPHGTLPNPGLIAIVAFFFLSGYLMPATLNQNYAGKTFAERSIRYLLNRLLRIYPTYWIALALTIVTLLVFDHHRDLYRYDSVRSYLQNFVLLGLNQAEIWKADQRFVGPAWTLDVELQYYLIVPLIVMAMRATPRLTLAVLVTVAVAGLWFQIKPAKLDSIDRSLLPWFAFFVAGALSYWYRGALGPLLPQLRAATLSATIAGIAAAFVSAGASHWFLAIAGMLIAAVLLLEDRPPWRFDQYLGDLSYPVFLLHSVVIATGLPAYYANAIAPNSILISFAIIFILTLPLSIAVEKVVDRFVAPLRARLKTSPGLRVAPAIVDQAQSSRARG